MLKPDDTETNESMSLEKLIDLNGIQILPQLSAVIKRRISAEAGQQMLSDEEDSTVADQVSFLEETICELVDLLTALEMEVQERRRFKRILR